MFDAWLLPFEPMGSLSLIAIGVLLTGFVLRLRGDRYVKRSARVGRHCCLFLAYLSDRTCVLKYSIALLELYTIVRAEQGHVKVLDRGVWGDAQRAPGLPKISFLARVRAALLLELAPECILRGSATLALLTLT